MSSQILHVLGVAAIAMGVLGIGYIVYRRRKKVFLNNVLCPVRLVDKEIVTHDTIRLTFALPSVEHVLGLPIGQHIQLSALIDGTTVLRMYTPVTDDDLKGYFRLVVKVYRAGTHPKFPEGGKMSQHLYSLSIGDYIDVDGPLGRLIYQNDGLLYIREKNASAPVPRKVSRIGMIAGGSGITPMYQMIQWILKHPSDKTELFLLYANKSEADILLRDELEALRDNHRNQFTIWYTVDEADEDWTYSTGFVNDEMIRKNLPSPGDDMIILLCGPPPMIKNACFPALGNLGYTSSMYFKY